MVRYIDFSVQSLLFMITPAAFFQSERFEAIIFFLIGQFILGCWQLLSAVITKLFKRKSWNIAITRYLITAIAYLGFWLASINCLSIPMSREVLIAWTIIPSWSLAIWYFVITIKITFLKPKRGSFLPNVSF